MAQSFVVPRTCAVARLRQAIAVCNTACAHVLSFGCPDVVRGVHTREAPPASKSVQCGVVERGGDLIELLLPQRNRIVGRTPVDHALNHRRKVAAVLPCRGFGNLGDGVDL